MPFSKTNPSVASVNNAGINVQLITETDHDMSQYNDNDMGISINPRFKTNEHLKSIVKSDIKTERTRKPKNFAKSEKI